MTTHTPKYRDQKVKVTRNYGTKSPAFQTQVEVDGGVYFSLNGIGLSYAYTTLSTKQAREIAAALVELADEIEAELKAAYPEEPKGWLVIVKFPRKVPAQRTSRDGLWKFATTSREYTWEQLLQHVGYKPEDSFEILYQAGE